MRLATILEVGRPVAAVVRDAAVLPLSGGEAGLESVRAIAAGGRQVLERVRAWADSAPASAWQELASVELGPVVPDPAAIYTIGHNYRIEGDSKDPGPPRPLVYGKAAASVGSHGSLLTWDRSLTDNVDAEVELGVVIGVPATGVPLERALEHVFGYTIINDISSRDEWLDGDQWLLGKSMPGFCPVGPSLVTPDELDPRDLGLGCTINGQAIQQGRTSQMRYSTAEVISYLSRHLTLRPGDLIATGTPARLDSPPGPGRRLQPGDQVTVWIQGIGELSTTIA